MRRPAFTLVELLVVVSIITVVTGAMIPSFAGYLKQQNLIQAQEQLKSDLRSVQNKALTGAMADKLINGNQVTHWGLVFPTTSTYDYFYASNTTSCTSATSVVTYGNGTLPANVTVSYPSITSSLKPCIFVSLLDGTMSTRDFGGATTLVTLTTNGLTKSVKFNSMGLISTE